MSKTTKKKAIKKAIKRNYPSVPTDKEIISYLIDCYHLKEAKGNLTLNEYLMTLPLDTVFEIFEGNSSVKIPKILLDTYSKQLDQTIDDFILRLKKAEKFAKIWID